MKQRFKFFYSLTLLFAVSSICLLAHDTIKVACVGNSITYGIGVTHRATDAYPAQLQRLLGPHYVVGNFGKPSATLLRKGNLPYMEQEEFQKALAFRADYVIIHLGVNDTDPSAWPNYRDDFMRDYLALIQAFRQAQPKANIFIAGITPIGDRHRRFPSGTQQWQDKIRATIATVAEIAQVNYIDFYTPLYSRPDLLPDAIHPNTEGSAIMARIVWSAITGNYGGLQLSPLYTDRMVLQRDTPLCIKGTANAGERVTVRIGGQKRTATANCRGQWHVWLAPLAAGTRYELTVSTPHEKKTFRQVAAGEVWLCSGQSNMAFVLKQALHGDSAIQQARIPDIRLFNMKGRWPCSAAPWPASAADSVNRLLYFQPTAWHTCSPETAADFSAVAYYFGKMLHDSLQVPVGLICNAVGGATTESWIDRHSLETQFLGILKNWTQNDFIQEWARQRALLNLKNSTSAALRHPFEPCYLYESGILPLQQYPIKGVIWYQGESNAHNMEAHESLFPLLVASWRHYWNNDSLPFYFVQLSSLNRPSWPWFRDSQRRLMHSLPHTGMAVSSDCGDSLDVHPRNKRPVGERLARWALAETYGHPLTPSGPLFRQAVAHDDGRVSIHFDYGEGLRPAYGDTIVGFEVAQYEGFYFPAKASIKNDVLTLQSDEVSHPRFVRYGWQPFTRANLVNRHGLPASTFRGPVAAE